MAGQRKSPPESSCASAESSLGNSPASRLCDRSSSTKPGSAKSDLGTAPSSPTPRRCRCVSRVSLASVASEGNENETPETEPSVPSSPLAEDASSASSSTSSDDPTSSVSPSLSSCRLAQSPTDSGIAPTSPGLPLRSTRRVYGPQIPAEGRLPRSAFERKLTSTTRFCAIHPPSPSSVSNAFPDASRNVSWDKHATSGNAPSNAFPWISRWSRKPLPHGEGNVPVKPLCARLRRIKSTAPKLSNGPSKSFSLRSTSLSTGYPAVGNGGGAPVNAFNARSTVRRLLASAANRFAGNPPLSAFRLKLSSRSCVSRVTEPGTAPSSLFPPSRSVANQDAPPRFAGK